MPLRPILSSLSHHKLTASLLVLEVACTCAIVCNVAFMIVERSGQINLASGVTESELVLIDSLGIDDSENRIASHDEDLNSLRRILGVTFVAAVDSLPLSNSNWSNRVSTSPDSRSDISASAYNGTPGEIKTLGLNLIAGRDFQPDEYRPMNSAHGYTGLREVPSTIITSALANRLFPEQNALGKSLYFGGPHAVRIVGIVDHLLRPSLGDAASNEYSTLLPMLPDESRVTYVLRAKTGDRDRVLKSAAAALVATNPNRVLRRPQTFTQLREKYFQRDQNMIGLLYAASGGLLFVTALGIAGLASFWVQQRTRQIGIRRALGAKRSDILRYFQIENFVIVSLGVLLGVALGFGLNLWLMTHFELPRLPLIYLPVGATALWLLGQVAVFGPAMRASRVPPVVATRSI